MAFNRFYVISPLALVAVQLVALHTSLKMLWAVQL